MDMQQGSRAATAVALAEESLARTGKLRMRATGASMLPGLRPGDELQFLACPAAELAPGNIALCRREGRLIAHRVLRLVDGALLTQGDALARPDSPFCAVDVLGRLESFDRRSRRHQPPSFAGFQRLGSTMFRRSEFLTRMFIRWLDATRQRPA